MTIPIPAEYTPEALSRVGKTPMARVSSVKEGTVFAKFEHYNPTGSHKDRPYLHMISAMERAGQVKEGDVLVDYTTGNGGASLAFVARCKGYRAIAVMPRGITPEREEQIRALGAELILTPREDYVKAARQKAQRIVDANPGTHHLVNQSDNPLNAEAFEEMGQEIADSLEREGQKLGALVCGIGTGGTMSGIAKALKARWPDIKTIGVEVVDSAPIFAKRNDLPFHHRDHRLVGFGAGAIAKNTNEDLIDRVEIVSYEDSLKMALRIAIEDGQLVGPSSGANLLIARKWAGFLNSQACVATVFFDDGFKYSEIYKEAWAQRGK